MQIETRVSQKTDGPEALEDLLSGVDHTSLASVVCYYTSDYSPLQIQKYLTQRLPNVATIGCSTCGALLTERGIHQGPVIGLLLIYDEGLSAYGTGLINFDSQQPIDIAAIKALESAIEQADRVGELPSFIMLHATPGSEESIIDAIDGRLHTAIPIIGGSAADAEIEGNWSVFSELGVSSNGMALMVFYPSDKISTGFSGGFSPTEFSGTVTKASGRELIEIDHLPAERVYREWISDHAGVDVPEEFVFELVTQYPIGRIAGEFTKQQQYYKLSHPIRKSNNNGLHLFTNINEGDEITLMSGNREQLISRPARVLAEAHRDNPLGMNKLGAVCIICAGPMRLLGDDLQTTYEQIAKIMGKVPFICPFTFGEQGRFIGGENGHGNLMVTTAIFHSTH
ncbi:FIST signal transduction protein [Vibrio sp.]|uniref:FIST signal transduction protein n=1 Tax=Vibrio sp. TaxID=678 RepID=UPI003D0B2302